MVYFDLDGVLRDLCGAAGIEPETYDCKVGPFGQSFMDFFGANPELLLTAKPTEYLHIADFYHKYISKITILTNQVESWKSSAVEWVNTYFKDDIPEVIFAKSKLAYLSSEKDLLIEDDPNLSDYSQVMLIDRSYNRNITLPHQRIRSPRLLIRELLRRQYGLK
jgi:hypothetical protein